jgi:integrase
MCTYLDQVGPTYYFRRSVPQELQPFILTATGNPRTEFKISLRTKDRETAKRRLQEYVKMSDGAFDAARIQMADVDPLAPVTPPPAPFDPFRGMTQEQFERQQEHARQVAQEMDARDDRREKAQAWRAQLPPNHYAAMLLKDERERGDRYQDRYRRRKRRDTAAGAARDSQGTETASPLPNMPKPANDSQRTPSGKSVAVTITGLFKGYAGIGNKSPAILKEWTTKINRFVEFLGHDDAAKVTPDNIQEWRNAVRDEILPGDKRRSAQTVNAGYLSPVRSAFKHGMHERLITFNPAHEVPRVQPVKAPKIRDKDFTRAEQRTILTAASKVDTSGQPTQQSLVRRWVPWICAYTGARVNEITQLRAEDVQEIDGHWIINITPEAGRVKTNEFRVVPLHEHLIAQGFLAVVKAQKDGPIFYDPKRGDPNSERGQYKKVGERLATWVRSIGITDKSIKPSHAWRHTFKTIANEVGMSERAADYMQGHSSKGVGRTYGRSTIKALVDQMALFPRFEID